jgi:hypothetical protein
VLLDLLVELVAFLAVLLGLVDLLAGLRVEFVALGGALAGLLVEFVPPVSELTGSFDELTLRLVLQVVVCQFYVLGVVNALCHGCRRFHYAPAFHRPGSRGAAATGQAVSLSSGRRAMLANAGGVLVPAGT